MSEYFVYLPCSVTLNIEYVNSAGERSDRIVDVKQFVSNSPAGQIKAFCHKRKSVRSFNYSGIVSATDIVTGEIIPSEHLFLYLQKCYDGAPEREFDFFLSDMKPLVEVLIFIGVCDGKFAPSEQKQIAEWLLGIAEIENKNVEYAVNVIQHWPIPNFTDFLHAVRKINQYYGEYKDRLLEQAEKVALADRKLVDDEKDTLQILKMMLAG